MSGRSYLLGLSYLKGLSYRSYAAQIDHVEKIPRVAVPASLLSRKLALAGMKNGSEIQHE